MASYKISFKRSAEKDLRRIDKSQISRIITAIEDLSKNPHPQSSRKLVGSNYTYRLRVGDYRVIYFVFDDLKEVEIQKVRHRKDIYR